MEYQHMLIWRFKYIWNICICSYVYLNIHTICSYANPNPIEAIIPGASL